MIGTLYGIGVGPGDPELLTVKAFRRLKEAHVIAYPKKANGSKSYAQQIVDAYFSPKEKQMLGLVFPMTKDENVLREKWNETVETVWTYLREGKHVAFVTEGDPLLYSTWIHFMRTMQMKYPDVSIEIVPGISSINGAAARLQLPLADGDETVAIVPARDDYYAMKKVIETHDCVIFLKVAKVMSLLLAILREMNITNKAAVVTKVTSHEEVIWNIEQLEQVSLPYLTLMVVRK
ncbi:precorrin-2 C(20)-methyltransferase [Anoxybacillus sp. LAT_35]|uniref:precorrin-2 C(20)-methyltransferase n=1 Tax=Anoxybacillus TaxID=150247 RepID=UPI001EDC36A1|nr:MULTISPECIES: precorrin-2 C(20)-methyltransferase [Anoxybacillus]MCG5025399.1 precorrin-2 C(20)-methyltransferase [Anoxybacillus flavithermus]MCG6196211.1 precorrin-2 C(20)-methyltransferase [Anoxybacillus sp. LAT_38]MCG3083774.1 precorrin-2 C(20)-methyltransferase [Anoxybacillus sp. LAT27]MCG6170424.1 precorrin-2 C(20)-methyltransferase [Anoxybacillus sp. LAT_11]MCG6175372.1 precorrin-2 C(20)-methyltransferase [Anoxybacillus sp. LAT_31]